MSWRTVVVSKTAKLDYSLGCLVVRDVESTAKVHISEISLLIIESVSASVTSYLLYIGNCLRGIYMCWISIVSYRTILNRILSILLIKICVR